jgi:hypothetical protein
MHELNTAKELPTRWDYADGRYARRDNQDFFCRPSRHSLLVFPRLAADVMVQEYGRYFGLPTCCLRGYLAVKPFRRRFAWLSKLPGEVQPPRPANTRYLDTKEAGER